MLYCVARDCLPYPYSEQYSEDVLEDMERELRHYEDMLEEYQYALEYSETEILDEFKEQGYSSIEDIEEAIEIMQDKIDDFKASEDECYEYCRRNHMLVEEYE